MSVSAPSSDPNLEDFLRHGGRLAAARRAFPDAPAPWLDLSTGINPRPWKGARATAASLTRLPDPDEIAALEAAAAAAFGVTPDRVAAVPGAEAALRALPRLLGARSVAIASPTYGAHAEAWRLAGAKVQCVAPGELAGVASEAVVMVNPNNPDGARHDDLEPGDRWLIVDESFVETAPELSVAARAGHRLIVLRSFGKFYGLAGVRLGFVIAEPGLAARIGAQFGDWPVSAEAIAAGTAAYADSAWREAAAARLTKDAARLDAMLTRAGFDILGGTSLFRLAATPDAARRFTALARGGVLTRPFPDQPTWLRFGLPKPKDWPRLQAALEGSRR
ncbi:threonine-phosphate decarboxylase CobD [Phenylobacterium sp. Root700]|uniref:threonine-phosphate decarboxylase CobD n=1 Tax=Phenylobacterium sp. Root700 TaxID=1736591 RepID=UPI000701447D|nr:threonine-phosphate decarboxylase CobD [Phenylobacterium sp. Root700]KRB41971.1 threonine-phosphate decarboxylase [Phenylobacterium sp. Root700]